MKGGILIVLLLFSACSFDDSTSAFLDDLVEDLSTDYQETKSRILVAIDENPEDNQDVKTDLSKLDSLLRLTSVSIKDDDDVVGNLRNFVDDVNEQVLIGINHKLSSPHEFPSRNKKVLGLIKLFQYGKDVQNELARHLNETAVRFDQLGVFIEVKTPVVQLGDSIEADIYFGAFSRNSQNVFEIYADGQLLKINNGAGKFKLKANSRGINQTMIVVKGKSTMKYWEGFSDTKEIRYLVR